MSLFALLPRTPSECRRPPLNVLRTDPEGKDGEGRFLQKVGGRGAQNRWIRQCTAHKSLIVYKSTPTGCRPFSTCCASASTCCPCFSTCRLFGRFASSSLYLSLFKEEEGRKTAKKEEQASTGFRKCLFFNPRVFRPIHPFSVDICGSCFAYKSWR